MSKIYWVRDIIPDTTLTGFLVSTGDIPDALWNAFEDNHGFWSMGWTEREFNNPINDRARLKRYLPADETIHGGAIRPTHDEDYYLAYLPKKYESYFIQNNEWGEVFP